MFASCGIHRNIEWFIFQGGDQSVLFIEVLVVMGQIYAIVPQMDNFDVKVLG